MGLWLARATVHLSESVKNYVERSLRHDSRVQLFQRASRGVARIRKRLLACCFAFGVQFGKAGFREINLTPRFKQGWQSVRCAVQFRWNASDSLQVGGY